MLSYTVVKAHRDRERATPAERGYGPDWVVFRKLVLAARPHCETPGCGSTRRLNVHHRQSIRTAPARRLDPTNVSVLCHVCHSRHTAKHDGGFGHQAMRPTLSRL